MLKRLFDPNDTTGAAVKIAEANFPAPFVSGLEYGAPARGTWNIVHTGMLIPDAHQVFVCASNCLRGVVLTAAEMNASHRFSTVTIKENNVLEGDMEDLIIEGVSDIINKLAKRPPAVLVYTSCIHHFIGCDLSLCYKELRKRFPDIAFTDCYMNPIMRKSGLTPDQIMRRQLYSILEPKTINPKSINIIGNNYATDGDSDIVRLIRKGGYSLKEVPLCNTYEEYQQMAESFLNISYNPAALAGGEYLKNTLGQQHIYLPLSYNKDEIRNAMKKLSEVLGIEYKEDKEDERKADYALSKALEIIGDAPITIDYTATTRPLSLARLLIEKGFNVERVYADSFSKDDHPDFLWLRENSPDLDIYATVHVKLRVLPRNYEQKTLAIGQKAAYFTGTANFVNIVEGGGYYGFSGIEKLAKLMVEAFIEEKDTRCLIQQKGLGCESCI
ncbi:MAG: nitrogenase [Firmicutes bacterium]|nr:nitrogenase [Bacillota bacterium]